MSPAGYTKDVLVEQPAIALLAELGWERFNGEFDHTVSALVASDQIRSRYLSLVNTVHMLYEAVLPDPAAQEFALQVSRRSLRRRSDRWRHRRISPR
jgi:hypothetical protein